MTRVDVPPGSRVSSRGYREQGASPGRCRDHFNRPTLERELAAVALACIAKRFGLLRVALRMLDDDAEEKLLETIGEKIGARMKAYRA